MENRFKQRGPLKSSKPNAGGGNTREMPVFGIVKNNIDPIRSGRLQVYISDFSGDNPDDPKNWVTVSFMSPFYGFVRPSAPKTGYGEYINNPASYGVWNSPPDIGTTVICLFINGDMNYGYYIGCVPEPEALRMIPAIGGNFSDQGESVVFNAGEADKLGGATRVPVTNMNINNPGESTSANFLKSPKPVHSYQASILFNQGLIRDTIRGVISTSSQRESPSRVGWGISTPGRPIYEGGSTDSSIVADAEKVDKTQLKVISRRGGHSFIMDDGDIIGRDQLVRIRTSLGHQILMNDSPEGQTLFIIHANGQSYIELGKEGTIDMYSTNSVNIRTQGDLNLHADRDININAAKKLNIQADSIQINSDNDIKQKAGTNYNLYTQGTHTHKVDGALSLLSGADLGLESAGTAFIKGSIINLNSGSCSTTPQKVDNIPLIAHTDTLFDNNKGYLAAPGKLLSIVSRAPAHTPWTNACQGVDVKTNLSASANLPSAPSNALGSVNNVANKLQNNNTLTTPVAATVPSVAAASKALDKNSTSAIAGALSVNAATGAAKEAVNEGAAIVNTANGKIAAVGSFAQTPKQLTTNGILKPGSEVTINRLTQQGKSVEQALTPNMFTGNFGAFNLSSFTQNLEGQMQSTVASVQKAQAALTKSGVLSGKEGVGSIGGVIASAVENGAAQTINAVKGIADVSLKGIGDLVSAPANSLKGAADAVLKSMNSGNFAGKLADNVTSGLSGIGKSISGGLSGLIDSAKGVAAAAFDSIAKSLKSFKAGIPQDTGEIAKKAEEAGQSATSIASGVSNLPGGEQAVAAVVDQAKSNVPEVPGGAAVKGLMSNVSTSVSNNINLQSATDAAVNLAGPAIAGARSITSNTLDRFSNISNQQGALGSAQGALQGALGSAQGALQGALGSAQGLIGGVGSFKDLNLDKLKGGTSSLTSLLSKDLPTGLSAKLNTAMSAITAGGGIKMPTPALGTNDTAGQQAAASSILGNPKIPAPNFTGSPPKTADLEAAQAKRKEELSARQTALKELQDKAAEATKALSEFNNLKQTLPEGDPAIDEAKAKYDALAKEKEKLFIAYFEKYPS